MEEYLKQVVVTGDVSAITEGDLVEDWCAEVAKEIWEQRPAIGIVHVQSLQSAHDPNAFARRILKNIAENDHMQRHFHSSRAFFDTVNTGLGSIFFFRDTEGVEYYDRFSNTGYEPMKSSQTVGGSEPPGFIARTFHDYETAHVRLSQNGDDAPQTTGWLLARFRLYGKEMSFININLHSVPFEDVNEIASNKKAYEERADMAEITKAAQKRQDQIEELISELESEGLRHDAVLVAGSFNAQLHETRLLTDLASTQRADVHARRDETGKLEAIEQTDRLGRKILTVEEHRFDLHTIHDWFFRLGRGQMAKKYNGELALVAFRGALMEESVFFQPSRYYGIDKSSGKEEFRRDLCPAWADRVLYNDAMNQLFRHDSFCSSGLYYGLVGGSVCIGKHKPVALHATICVK